MATRPIFVPSPSEDSRVRELSVDFVWHAGMDVSQKRKSIASLHESGNARLGLQRILEVSTRSPIELGRMLSAFNMRVVLADGSTTSVEAAYQGSKVFMGGGPFIDLLRADARTAKTDARLKTSGPLVRFELEGLAWELDPPTAFYDWLYLNALAASPALAGAREYEAFTDIEFNPARSLNCQARSVALFCSLSESDVLQDWLASPERFLAAHGPGPIERDSCVRNSANGEQRGLFG